jgi:glycosyltransferase involved in cell wall biosynthesis
MMEILINSLMIATGPSRGGDLVFYLLIFILFVLIILAHNHSLSIKIIQTQIIRHLAIREKSGTISHNQQIIFVIPSYNEHLVAVETVEKILKAGYGVVFVDDGSRNDEAYQALKRKSLPNLVCIQHPVNLGQGAALQTGADYVIKFNREAEFFVHFDADGQHRLENLENFLEQFKKNPDLDIVIGSRFLGNTIGMNKKRKRHKQLSILFMKLFVGLKLTDTHNGFRVIRVSALSQLTITMNRMAHASEIEELIKKHKLNYAEAPMTVIYSEYALAKGQKLGNAISVVKDFLYKKIFFG